MTHEVRTPPLRPAAIAAGQAATQPSAMDYVDEALEGLWQLLTSMRVAMVLMIVLAALCVGGSLLLQIPSGMLGDPASSAQWLNTIRPMYGGWTNVFALAPGVLTLIAGVLLAALAVARATSHQAFGQLTFLGAMFIALGAAVLLTDTLGLFNVFNSLVFKVLVLLLVISLVACSVHRLPGVWRTATKPRVDVGPSFFEHAPQREQIVVHASSAQALEQVKQVLRRHHYRTLVHDDGTLHLYGDRNRFVAFASLAGHISLILILLGAIIGSTYGYKNSSFAIAEGSTLPTGTEPGLSLKLIDFTDTWYTTAANLPEDYASKVELYKDGTQVAASTIRVNQPLSYDGATYYQSSYGQAAVMTVKDASGATVYSQGLPLDETSADGADRPAGQISIPNSSDEIYVFGTTGTSDTLIQPGQVRAVLVSAVNSSSVADLVIDQGKATKLGNYTVTFDRESKYSVLSINRDPGQFLIWIGALLLFGGFTAVFLLPQRRVWARITSRGATSVLSVASLGRRDAALGTDFDDLITDIRTALQASASA
jgi:cytochrome c biogenesis protein